MDLYSFKEYRDVIASKLRSHANTRGYKARLAEAAGCQRSFLSQVVGGGANLTAEHAVGLSSFWGFNSAETDYWVQLVQYARAGSPALRAYCLTRMESIRKDVRQLSSRFKNAKTLATQHQMFYYRSWHPAAIHALAAIPSIKNAEEIARRLRLSRQVVDEILSELVRLKVLKPDADCGWIASEKDLFLTQDSLMQSVYHASWRHVATDRLHHKDETALHYTNVHALSREDMYQLRDMLLTLIDDSKALVAPSREEDAIAVCIDFFRL